MSAETNPSLEPIQDELLGPRLDRLRGLRSAWAVLAPTSLVDDVDEVGATGRALTRHLSTIAESHSDVSPSALTGIDNLLAEFETSIRHVATQLPVAQLRSALPCARDEDRAGLLDLLDVLIARGPADDFGLDERIGAVDYLVTLLCTQGAERGSVRFDPVTLTERLSNLCAAHDAPDDQRLAEIEGEFFAAANLDAEELREELRLRTLRQRKTELGLLYFAPRVLRAIVTYNAALLVRVEEELLDSADWGEVGSRDEATPNAEVVSVFASDPLRALAAAVRRRLAEEAPAPDPIDRIAWALDLDYLAARERSALESGTVGTSGDPLGTAVLIGLLCRSVAVLGVDLQAAGLPPDQLTGPWVDELGGIFQTEINRNIADDAYRAACALSELKNKFLLEPLAEHLREERAERLKDRPHAAAPCRTEARRESEASRENARDLVREALLSDGAPSERRGRGLRKVPRVPLARGLCLVATIVVGVWLFLERDGDLDRLGRDQLTAVSPYLESGRRDAAGTGRSFVGQLDEAWIALPADEREAIAGEIVDRLRAKGMQQVMIYDDDRRVRIQALGSQPMRVL